MSASWEVDNPAEEWLAEEEDDMMKRVPCQTLEPEARSALVAVIRESNFQEVHDLMTILKKTDADPQDTSMAGLEEEERQLLEAAEEDQEGRLVNGTPVTMDDGARGDQAGARGDHDAAEGATRDPDLLCKIMITRQRKVIPCGERFNTYDEMLNHVEVVHRLKKALVCAPCRIRFQNLKQVVRHSLVCPHNQSCPFCPQRYGTLMALRVHIKAQHGDITGGLSDAQHRELNKDRICPQCHKIMSKPSVVKKHLERGKCIPVPRAPEPAPPASSLPGPAAAAPRDLRRKRGRSETLEPLGSIPQPGPPNPPRDHRGNEVPLPQEPVGPQDFDILFPHAQTKEQVRKAGSRGNRSVTIPLTLLTDSEQKAGAFCLAYRCGLCHFVVVSDLGALIYHQSKCKRVDLRGINKEDFMHQNRCFLCGRTLESFAQFMEHYSKCRNEDFNASRFQWYGLPPPLYAQVLS